MKKRAFILLEISCTLVLFMTAFLPFISIQKEILLFFQIKEQKYQERWDIKNAISILKSNIKNQKISEGRYYYENGNWSGTEGTSLFFVDVKKVSLKSTDKEEEIYFYQMFDVKLSKKIWEGWSEVG